MDKVVIFLSLIILPGVHNGQTMNKDDYVFE